MSAENNFKETEISPIPVDWEATTIGELVADNTLRLQNGFPCGNHNQEGRGIPHLRPFNVDSDGDISLDTIKYIETDRDLERYLLAQGDVIFNNTNSEKLVGKTAYWGRPGRHVLSNHMTIVRVLDESVIDPFYLARHLHKRWYDGFYRGVCRRHVNQASISLTRLKGVPIVLPPLPEQRRIAHVLSTIQRAIAAQDDLIAAAREVKRSLMQRLFTYGPGVEPVPTKETEIGEIPEQWEVVRLGEALQATQYGLSVRADRTGKYPMLRMNNLKDGHIDASDLKYVDLNEDDFEKFCMRKRDILFNRTNSYELVGKTAIFDIEGDFVFASYLIRVVPDAAHLLPEYLNYCLNWDDTQRRLKMLATRGVSQSNISATKLKRFALGLPSLAEQEEIVRMLSMVDRKIEAEQQRKAALQALFKSMLHQLMTGRVRV